MTAIAPVLFDAYPEKARHTDAEPYRECFNAGASSTGAVEALSTPYEPPRATQAATMTIIVGLIPLVGSILIGVFMFLFFHDDHFHTVTPEWLGQALLSGFVLTAAGVAWCYYLLSHRRPEAKAWSRALGDAWAAHGADITDLEKVGYQIREEVRLYAATLEKIRKSLNGLDPDGDELDVARYALQRYIEVSDIPVLGKRAAEANHIKDPKVRQAAKDYKAMLEQQKHCRRAVEDAVAEAGVLLAARRQARTDAEIIRLVHKR